jgi:gamma-glutamylputrescine oxidase
VNRAFDDNTSVWLDDAPPDAPAPALSRDLDIDVAIIGGGFTGVSAAYHLSKRHPKLGIALLEATQLANGASGRNGGLVLNGITVLDPTPELVAREHAITNAAIDNIEEIIREHQLAVRFQRTGCFNLATTEASAEAAQRECEKLRALGMSLEFLSPAALEARLRIRHTHGAVFDPGEGVLAGVDLIRGLRPVLTERGVQIYERTPVTKIREGVTCELVTPNGTVRAKAIVLATSGYTPRLGYFKSGLLPVISHVISTAPVPAELLVKLGLDRCAGFFDDSPRLAYASVLPDRRIVFGGGSTTAYGYRFGNATTYDARPDDDGAKAVHAMLLHYLPELADLPITHRWSGPLDLTLVRHCAIGVRGSDKNVFYGVGYSGHGITLANLAGRVIADLYDGNHEPWKQVAFYQRRPSGIPPEPFRWLGYHLYTKLTGKSPWKRT